MQKSDLKKSRLAKRSRNQVTSIQLHEMPATTVGQADGHGRIGIKKIRNASKTTHEKQQRRQKESAKLNASEATRNTKPIEGVE
jgi:hypothetical protein